MIDWIKITDKLPECGIPVLAYWSGVIDKYFILSRCASGWSFVDNWHDDYDDTPQELPVEFWAYLNPPDKKVTLNITKVSKLEQDFEFEDEFEEL